MSGGALINYSNALIESIETSSRLALETLDHPGEKGRALENIIGGVLRRILPPRRFSIGTGFITNNQGQISSQQDIVIYDECFNAPLMFDGAIGLFPIECVYGVVEVKAWLKTEDLSEIAAKFEQLRNMSFAKSYVKYGPIEVEPGKKVVGIKPYRAVLAPRTFLFALKTKIAQAETVESGLRNALQNSDGHVHGLIVLKPGWFWSQIAYSGARFQTAETDAFRIFCVHVLHTLNSMPMGWPNIDAYHIAERGSAKPSD